MKKWHAKHRVLHVQPAKTIVAEPQWETDPPISRNLKFWISRVLLKDGETLRWITIMQIWRKLTHLGHVQWRAGCRRFNAKSAESVYIDFIKWRERCDESWVDTLQKDLKSTYNSFVRLNYPVKTHNFSTSKTWSSDFPDLHSHQN